MAHVDEGRIGEDDIGRHIAFGGQVAPDSLEAGQHVGIDIRCGGGDGGLGAAGFLLEDDFADLDAGLAAQHGLAGLGQTKPAIPADIQLQMT